MFPSPPASTMERVFIIHYITLLGDNASWNLLCNSLVNHRILKRAGVYALNSPCSFQFGSRKFNSEVVATAQLLNRDEDKHRKQLARVELQTPRSHLPLESSLIRHSLRRDMILSKSKPTTHPLRGRDAYIFIPWAVLSSMNQKWRGRIVVFIKTKSSSTTLASRVC